MSGQYWKQVVASGLEVPQDRPLVIETHIDPAQYEAQF